MRSWIISPSGLTVFSEEGDLVAEFDLAEAVQIAECVFSTAQEKLNDIRAEHMNNIASAKLFETLRIKGVI